jgi:hypothetical protein
MIKLRFVSQASATSEEAKLIALFFDYLWKSRLINPLWFIINKYLERNNFEVFCKAPENLSLVREFIAGIFLGGKRGILANGEIRALNDENDNDTSSGVKIFIFVSLKAEMSALNACIDSIRDTDEATAEFTDTTGDLCVSLFMAGDDFNYSDFLESPKYECYQDIEYGCGKRDNLDINDFTFLMNTEPAQVPLEYNFKTNFKASEQPSPAQAEPLKIKIIRTEVAKSKPLLLDGFYILRGILGESGNYGGKFRLSLKVDDATEIQAIEVKRGRLSERTNGLFVFLNKKENLDVIEIIIGLRGTRNIKLKLDVTVPTFSELPADRQHAGITMADCSFICVRESWGV